MTSPLFFSRPDDGGQPSHRLGPIPPVQPCHRTMGEHVGDRLLPAQPCSPTALHRTGIPPQVDTDRGGDHDGANLADSNQPDSWLQQRSAALIARVAPADVDVVLAEVKEAAARRVMPDARQATMRPVAATINETGGGQARTSWARSAGRRVLAIRPQVPRLPHSTQEEQFRQLVDAAVGGDPVAMQQVLESTRPIVLRYCRARIGRLDRSFASADDVAQEVCISLVMALPGYQDRGQPFLAFVYGIAQHKVADAHRAAARDRSLPVSDVPDRPDAAVGPEQQVLQGEAAHSMNQLLAVLTDKQREIVVLRVVAGLSSEETADAVGSTPGAVRVAQHRALAKLRKLLPSRQL
jgi:RNA polymerase sigma-70 factor (ECF subfamily)